ncbi:integrase_H2C2 domain-containing protein [Trichonephila clavipes]|nr:integrase_H2C2 domain-containing protein [Trichonephila clavipes]
MRKCIADYVKSYSGCVRYIATNQKPAGLLQAPVPAQRFESIAIDLFGPLPETTEGDESIVAQVDENRFTLDDHPLDVTVAVEQGEGISKKARETLCSTPLTKAAKIGKSKRKPNASVKTAEALAEAANVRKLAMEKDYQQIAQFREKEHRATMTYKRKEHILKMKVLKAKLEHYNMLNKKKMKLDLEKEN